MYSVFGDADLDVNYGSVEELGAAPIFASQEPQPPLDPAKHTDTIGETTSRASRLPSLTDTSAADRYNSHVDLIRRIWCASLTKLFLSDPT